MYCLSFIACLLFLLIADVVGVCGTFVKNSDPAWWRDLEMRGLLCDDVHMVDLVLCVVMRQLTWRGGKMK